MKEHPFTAFKMSVFTKCSPVGGRQHRWSLLLLYFCIMRAQKEHPFQFIKTAASIEPGLQTQLNRSCFLGHLLTWLMSFLFFSFFFICEWPKGSLRAFSVLFFPPTNNQETVFLYSVGKVACCDGILIWVAFCLIDDFLIVCLLVFREASDNLAVQTVKGSFSNASGITTNWNLGVKNAMLSALST